MLAGWLIPLLCGGSPVMPWGVWFCVLGDNPILSQPPLCLLVSARQLRHTRAAGCVASGHLYTLPLSLHPPPPVAHKVLVAPVLLPLASEKPRCCKGPGLGTFLSPVLIEKVKQATNLIWSPFSTHSSSCKERRGWAGGRPMDPVWCCSKPGALWLGTVHFWFTAARTELDLLCSPCFYFFFFPDWYS